MWVASQIVVGFGLLMWGGELLVRGAAAMASSFRISPLVIGLTVVAFGTSAPELGVSLQAALSGNADVAVGNVVGSNIINVLLILGAAALVTPLIVSSQLIRLDVPLMIAASLCMWAVAADGVVERWEGALFFVSLILYIFFCIRKSRSENKDVVDEFASEYSSSESPARGILVQVGLIVAGLVLLGLGSNLLVAGAITVAESFKVSQLVIGLTIVALGTSLPEMVTSVVASFRGQRDIAVGNIVGSNLFNILGVLGLTSAVSPTGVSVSPSAIQFDIPVMVGIAVLCYPVFVTGAVMRRWEGGVFLTYYVAYTTYIVLHAIKSPLIATFKQVVVFGVVPLTVLAFAVWIYQTLAARRRPEADDGPSEPS
jgi:cation:H+ antiporter